MKHLKTYIRLVLEENDSNTQKSKDITFGDLKKLLRMMKTEKITKSGLKAIAGITGKDAALTALDTIDAISNIGAKKKLEKVAGPLIKSFKDRFKLGGDKRPEKILAKMWGINDLEGVKNLSIPDELSNLIDDEVEGEFVIHLLDLIENESDDKILQQGWVLNKFKEFTKSNDKTFGSFADKS